MNQKRMTMRADLIYNKNGKNTVLASWEFGNQVICSRPEMSGFFHLSMIGYLEGWFKLSKVSETMLNKNAFLCPTQEFDSYSVFTLQQKYKKQGLFKSVGIEDAELIVYSIYKLHSRTYQWIQKQLKLFNSLAQHEPKNSSDIGKYHLLIDGGLDDLKKYFFNKQSTSIFVQPKPLTKELRQSIIQPASIDVNQLFSN